MQITLGLLPMYDFCNACKDDKTPDMFCLRQPARPSTQRDVVSLRERITVPPVVQVPPLLSLAPLPSSHGWRAHKALERTRTSLRLARPSGAAAAPRAVADGRPKLAGLGEACGRRAYARLRPPVRPRAASDGRMAARLHLSPPRGTAGNARPFWFWTIARNVLRRE